MMRSFHIRHANIVTHFEVRTCSLDHFYNIISEVNHIINEVSEMKELTMENVILFLNENPNGFLATMDGGKPKVRPMGFMMGEDETLYFNTNSLKDVYTQLLENPFVEYASVSKEMVTVRISGEVQFCEDAKIKEKVFNVNEAVKQGYRTAENPIYKVFYIKHGVITVSYFSGQPARKMEF